MIANLSVENDDQTSGNSDQNHLSRLSLGPTLPSLALGWVGEEDQQIFVEDVLEFEAALNSLEITNEVTIYEGLGHGFLNEDNFDEPGSPGDAWQQTLTYLEANLKN